MCRTSSWRPSSLFFCLSDWGIGWPPSTFGRRISRFLFIRSLVASFALWPMAALTSSKHCASICLWPRRSSLGLWLLSRLSYTPWVSVCVVTLTTGSFSPPHGRVSSGTLRLFCSLSGVGDRCQPGEIQLLSVSGDPVSRGGHRRADFYGFSIARSPLQAVVNRRRISALHRASCQLVAVAAGDVVLPVASGSRRLPTDAVTPYLPSPLLGLVGSFGSCGVVSGLSSRLTVVASRGSPLSRGVSPSGIPRSGLLV